MKNVASRGPLFSSGGSNGVEGFEYGYSVFPLIFFRSIFIFKVPMVEHGSDACPMVVLFHIGEVQTESFACSIIDGGGNQFAGAYSILVC